MLSYLLRFAQGLGIGIANVIPGVSGGTMALIFGIYEEVIGAASMAVRTVLKLVRGDFKGCVSSARDLPWLFLIPLAIGILAAPFLGAGLLSDLLDTRPVEMRGLFFGLIVGSLPIPWLRIGQRGLKSFALMAIAAAAAWLLSSIPAATASEPSLGFIFAAAAVAVSAMVLPGISGAYLLLILGIYEATLLALDTLNVAFLVVFALGAALGLAAFTVLLNWLLKHRHDATMAVLVGLMIGSLRALWPWATAGGNPHLPVAGDPVTPTLLLGLIGLAVTGGLSWWELHRGQARE